MAISVTDSSPSHENVKNALIYFILLFLLYFGLFSGCFLQKDLTFSSEYDKINGC